MKNTLKFAALQGMLGVMLAFLAPLLFSIPGLSRRGEVTFLFVSAICGTVLAVGPYVAGKRGWTSFAVSASRSSLSAVPLSFLGVAFIVGMIGWGDFQEHLIRAALHGTHREITDQMVGALIGCGVAGMGALGASVMLWLSLSIVTRKWSAKVLVVVMVVCLGLSGMFWVGLLASDRAAMWIGTEYAALAAIAGAGLALAMEMNATTLVIKPLFRISAGLLLVGIVAGSAALYSGSKPEKPLPPGLNPLWTFDIETTGCRPAWGGPDSSQASSQIRFVGHRALAMAFETQYVAAGSNSIVNKSCVFTIDVTSGKLIAQTNIDGERPAVRVRDDGNFSVVVGWNGLLKSFTPELQPLEDGDSHQKHGKLGTGAQFGDFRTEQNGNLWFTKEGKEVLLANFGGLISLHPLGESRMLVLVGHGFSLYSSEGVLIKTETFVREGVHFGGQSENQRSFALSVYLWGVGDPSYLEEERIVAYDSQTGAAIASVKAEPLPQTQSWTALSPDGRMLLVGARDKLRLFRLPERRTAEKP